MNEIFKPIKDFEDKYEISNLGNVKSISRKVKNNIHGGFRVIPEIILSPKIGTSGYKEVTLNSPKSDKTKRIHRLIAEHFLPTLEGKLIVNHKDGNKLNNSIDNLEWVTSSENQKHAFDMGLSKSEILKGFKGSKHPRTKLTENIVLELREKHLVLKSINKLTILYPQITKGTIANIVYRGSWRHI